MARGARLRFGDDWWRRGVVYQIYPRTFADSDGDGIGRPARRSSKLDYLSRAPRRLGVDAIWLSPIYPSPGLDVGYDVSDHDAVDPLFGTRRRLRSAGRARRTGGASASSWTW